MNTHKLRGNLLLIIAAMIWGSSFVAQSVGMDYVQPFTFQCFRSLLGAIVLIPVIFWMDHRNTSAETAQIYTWKSKKLWTAGILCGIVLFAATNLQQFGLLYTSAGKSGFITALYIILVPLLGLFVNKRIGVKGWLSVFLALIGMSLLCLSESLTLGLGEGLTLACALCFAFHILIIDHFSNAVDGIRLSCIQFAICGLISGITMLLLETPSITAIAACWLPIGYAGILSCGVAYTLQILGQKYTKPSVASLLLSLESVFSVLFGWLLLSEQLSVKEYIGCIIMFAAVILSQLPQKTKK